MSTSRLADRAVAFLAIVALIALLARVTDVRLGAAPSPFVAPPPPADVGDRDTTLVVRVFRAGPSADKPGPPIGGASVRVFWQHENRYYLAGSGKTGPDGSVRIGDLPRGEVWIVAEAPELARSSTRIVLDGGVREADVSLPTASTLQVTVSDDDGGSIERATVLVTAGDPLPYGALTGKDGVALFNRLGPSPWTVKASAPGYESITQSGVTGDVTIVLRRLGSLEVRVELPSGAPAPGATVVIAGSSLWPARRAETDAHGATRIAGLLAGSYDLKAIKGDLVSETLFGFSLERGGHETVTLRLHPGRMVAALVTDDDPDHPSPVRDADVVLAEGGLTSFPLRGRTTADGTVVLGPVSGGPATLSASAEGFVTRPAVAVPDVLEGPVKLVLLRGATLEGLVVDSKDRPIDGASIEVIGNDQQGMPVADTPMLMAFRRTHFEWSLEGPRPLVPAGDLGVMPGPIPPIPQGVSSITGADPTMVGPAPDEMPPDFEPWVTRMDGTFKAHPVTPGRVRALVRHPSYVEGISDPITLAPGGSGKVKVVLLTGGTLEGRVVDASGRGVSEARVDLTATRGTIQRTTLTASDGTFTFAAVPADVIVSVARPDDPSRLVVKKTVEVEEGKRKQIEIVLPGAREPLTISVLDDSNRPVDAAQVTVLSIDPSFPLRQTGFTRAEGTVEVADARGLALRIVVEAPGWALYAQSVDKAGEKLEIKLVRGLIVQGKITSLRGRRDVEGASVTLVSEGRRAVAMTDKDGIYRVRDIAPGPVHLVVAHPEFAVAELNARVEDTHRADRPFELPAIDLSEPGAIEGEVLDARGKPVSGARVAIGMVPAFLPAGTLPPGMAMTDAKGRFKLDGLSPGKVDVEAYAPDLGRGAVRAVTVTTGRPTSGLSIRLTGAPVDDDPTVSGSVAVTLGESGSGDAIDVVIVHVADGSEAERSGLRPGDIILAVDGKDVVSMRDARARLSGPPSSDVVVEIERAEQTMKLRVGREQVRR